MRDKLEKLLEAYAELERKMVDPAIVSDPKEYARIAKEHANQAELVAKAREYLAALDDIDVAKEMLRETSDPDEKEMLQEDLSSNEAKLPMLEDEIKVMLIPGDPNDEKDTIVEIRGAAGGDEAAIFAGDLFKMYERFAASRGWKIEVFSSSPSDAGGFKTIEFKVTGDKVFSVMKYEGGVHRVQRVPVTESQGRIPPTPWCSRRTSARRFRTARSACRCCAPVCTRWSLRSSRQSLVPSAWGRSGVATAPRRFAPTTSRRTA